MSSELIKHVSDASFDSDVLKADKPVLVDYWAEWCGPCKMIAPILDEAAKDYGARLQIAKQTVAENHEVPAKFGIRGIPTLMLFKDGQLAATKVGALSKSQLTAFIDSHLSSPPHLGVRAPKAAGSGTRHLPAPGRRSTRSPDRQPSGLARTGHRCTSRSPLLASPRCA